MQHVHMPGFPAQYKCLFQRGPPLSSCGSDDSMVCTGWCGVKIAAVGMYGMGIGPASISILGMKQFCQIRAAFQSDLLTRNSGNRTRARVWFGVQHYRV